MRDLDPAQGIFRTEVRAQKLLPLIQILPFGLRRDLCDYGDKDAAAGWLDVFENPVLLKLPCLRDDDDDLRASQRPDSC